MKIRHASAALLLLFAVGACNDSTTTPAPTTTSPSGSRITGPPTIGLVPGTGSTSDALAKLRTAPAAPMTGYSRAQFGAAWTDKVTVDGGGNGCDTRNDILRRDLVGITTKPGTSGCVVATGTLHDPYTGHTIVYTRGPKSSVVQIDHMVPLGDAWKTGAAGLTAAVRTNLANDPLNLDAVDGPTNEAKGDADAASWLPPTTVYRCEYVARQIAVKSRYKLWVTPGERAALATVLGSCPGLPLPTGSDTAVPSPTG